MPTKPLELLLNRDISKAAAREVIKIASPLLQELINYGTNVFARSQDSAKGGPDEDLAVLQLYLHILEMVDGIEVLVGQCCITPTVPLLRSSFEALLGINYILDPKGDYTQRSLSWIVGYSHNRIKVTEGYISTTQQGKELRDYLLDEVELTLEPVIDIKAGERIDNLKKLLSQKKFEVIETEYQNLKISRRGDLNWYSLFGGPKNLRELALAVGKKSQYIMFYKDWSEITHAEDMRFLSKNSDGTPAFNPLRNWEKLNELSKASSQAARFSLEATRLILKKFRPGEEESLAAWYKNEIQLGYHQLMRLSGESK